MEKKIIKNIDKSKIVIMKDLVTYQQGQIVSKTLVQNKSVSITLFAFDKDEEISTHKSHGDALVAVLDGKARITIGDEDYSLNEGDSIVMPAEVPHAVYGLEPMKFMLTVVF